MKRMLAERPDLWAEVLASNRDDEILVSYRRVPALNRVAVESVP